MRLQEIFKQSGKTREEIASELGINEKTIYLWLSGRQYPRLSPNQLKKLAFLLPVSLVELLDLLGQLEYDIEARRCQKE